MLLSSLGVRVWKFNAFGLTKVPFFLLLLAPAYAGEWQEPPGPDFSAIRAAIESSKFEEAEGLLLIAMTRCRSQKDTLAACYEYYRLAVWLQNGNRFHDAARAAERCRRLGMLTRSDYWAVYGYLTESHMYWQLGDFETCANRLKYAMDIASRDSVRARMPHAYFSSLQRMAILQLELGFAEMALPGLLASGDFYKSKEHMFDLAAVYINLAEAYREMGRLDSAEFYLQLTLAIAPAIKVQPNDRTHAALANLGEISLRRGRLQEAILWQRRAIDELNTIHTEADESYVLLGNLYLHAGNLREAQMAYRTALHWNHRNYLAYYGLARTMETSNRTQHAAVLFDSAASLANMVLEMNPGRAVLATLKETAPVFNDRARFSWRMGQRDKTLQSMETYRGLYFSTMLAGSNSRRDRGNESRDTLHSLHGQIQRNRRFRTEASAAVEVLLEADRSRALKSGYSDGTLSLDSVHSNIGSHITILQFAVIEDSLMVVAITRDTMTAAVSGVPSDSLGQLIDRVTRNPAPQIADLHLLYQGLIGPIVDALPRGSNVVIIPDGPLYRLPFEMLVVTPGPDYRSCEYLVQRHPISYSVSLSVFLDQRKRFSSAPKNYFGFAGADFDSLPALPGAIQQVEWAESLFPHATAWMGSVHESAPLLHRAEAFRIIDFATHALVSDVDPMSSQIVLTRDRSLAMYEVYDMNLDADLVVLSGCRTGLGKLTTGEGYLGYNHAFSYAGAYSLLMSSRDLDDQATATIVAEFYRQLDNGKSRAVALQQAKIKYIQTTYDLKASPHYWAGLTLWGNPEPIPLVEQHWDVYVVAGLVGIAVIVLYRRNQRRI